MAGAVFGWRSDNQFELLIDGSALRQRGRTFLTFTAFLCGSVLVWIGYDYSQQNSTWFSLTVGFLLGLGALI